MLSCFVRAISAISRRHHAPLITTLAALIPILVVNNLNWITLCQFNNADENKTYPNALNAQSFYQKRSGILTRNTTRLCHRRATATHIKDDRRWARGRVAIPPKKMSSKKKIMFKSKYLVIIKQLQYDIYLNNILLCVHE